ncbi:MAG: hypothetical protein PHR65_06975, partial [Syntrophomonadaceae bacterium]|nr:hypothetical protein [Syntrophomonadaceae bacterium]
KLKARTKNPSLQKKQMPKRHQQNKSKENLGLISEVFCGCSGDAVGTVPVALLNQCNRNRPHCIPTASKF